MPRILDLEISTPRLIGRIFLAFILAGIDFFVFYVLISPHSDVLSRFLPASDVSSFENAMSSFVSSTLPLIGIVIAVIIFFDEIFKGTRISGGFMILTGSLFSWYTYSFFRGGTMTIAIPPGIVSNVSGSVLAHATLLMWLFILPSLLTIVKGALMLYASNKRKPIEQSSKNAQPQITRFVKPGPFMGKATCPPYVKLEVVSNE